MDSKRLERKLLRTVNKIRHDETDIVMQTSAWQVFILLSSVQFTRRNAQLHDPMSDELTGIENLLSMMLLAVCPWSADMLSLGGDSDLDLHTDGTPLDKAKFDAAIKRHMEGKKIDD